MYDSPSEHNLGGNSNTQVLQEWTYEVCDGVLNVFFYSIFDILLNFLAKISIFLNKIVSYGCVW